MTAAGKFVDRLAATPWFERCGSVPVRSAITVASWSEAAATGSSHAWANALIAAANALATTVLVNDARQERWNAIAVALKPRCAALVSERMASTPLAEWIGSAVLPASPASEAERQALIDRAVTRGQPVPEAGVMLLGNLEWVVLHAAIEADLAAKQPDGWFRRVAGWLTEGHFPCGWRGQPIAGELVVY